MQNCLAPSDQTGNQRTDQFHNTLANTNARDIASINGPTPIQNWESHLQSCREQGLRREGERKQKHTRKRHEDRRRR